MKPEEHFWSFNLPPFQYKNPKNRIVQLYTPEQNNNNKKNALQGDQDCSFFICIYATIKYMTPGKINFLY